MKSPYQEDQEAAVAEARQLSREQKNRRSLCSADIVAALIELFQSKNVKVQVDAIAALVNLSIEIQNKSMIVQAGALPFLIEVLNSGCPEAQEHAAAAAFTLAIAKESKHSMGILNAIPPLLKILNFGPEGARQNAAMALYELSLMQSNKSKLIKSGAIPILFNLAQSTERLGLVRKVLMVLVKVASVPEGRAALLQMNPIPALVRLLQIRDDSDATMIPEEAATLLLFLSKSNFRFKSIAENAGAIELLRDMVGRGTVRGRERASKLLEIMKDTSLGLDDSDRNPFLANQYMRFRINDGQPNSSAF
ncbi:hypothetical protein KP509_02G042800 [Ceratopteris richardii]|nr:hypothetical protein KP509_02G042800 [Ceratopteris richardii]